MLLALLIFCFAGLAYWMAFYVSRQIRRCRDWPTVTGTVLERGLGPPMHGPGRSYLPHVKYRYSVEGTEYVNDQVHLIRGTGGLADRMRRLAKSFPDQVPVHFNPQKPSESYLVANSMGAFWLIFCFAVFATLWGLVQLVTATR